MYFYSSWLVPSIISFLASSIVLFDVIYFSRRYTKKSLNSVEWRTVVFAITDLVQTSTWFLGNRRNHQENLCRVQEYLFEAATLSKVFLCITSAGILSYAVSARRLPNWRVLKGCEYGLMFLLVCLMVLLIYFDGSRPLCEMSIADDLRIQNPSRIVFFLAYMLPLQLSFFLTILLSIPPLILHREIAKTILKSILDRLVPLPLIFTFCFLPPLILSFLVVTTGEDSLVLYRLSAICVSLSGTIFATCHFYLRGKPPSRTQSTFANSISGVVDVSEAFGPMTAVSEQEMLNSIKNSSVGFDEEQSGWRL
jgi:hypothetical protein